MLSIVLCNYLVLNVKLLTGLQFSILEISDFNE